LEAGNQNATVHAAPAPTTSLPPPSTPPPIVPPNASWVLGPHPERRLLDVSNEALMNKCRAFVEQLRDGAAPWIVQKLSDSYGNMPTDAPSFGFWIALVSLNGWVVRGGESRNSRQVLPIDEYEKAKLLPIRSVRLRLRLVAHWIDQLNRNW